MKTTAEKIVVMQHYDNGGEIECRRACTREFITKHKKRIDSDEIAWSWNHFDYDIVNEPEYVYLWAYKFKGDKKYSVSTNMYKNEYGIKADFVSHFESLIRLDWSKTEVK